MYNYASAGIIIMAVIIMLVLKPLFKIIIDAIEKGFKDDPDSKK